MRYLPLDKSEREAMLLRIGAPDVEALFADIPADKRIQGLLYMPLAKSEMGEEWSKTKSAAVSFGTAAAVASVAMVLLSFMFVYLLNWLTDMALWGCFAIVVGLFAAVAFILFYAGRSQAEQIHVVPRQTVETMRENVQWLKNQT